MTTNQEWLFSLTLEEQYAWMNAERTESPTSDTMQRIGQVIESTVKRGVYGDTESENADSREKLEADVFACLQQAYITYPKVIELLDRQAAITEADSDAYWEERDNETITELQAQVDELTAERERYREKFGKCLDYADAIHALMDDEGMA